MPLSNTKPVRFRPRSLSDSLDGSNSPPGSCISLQELIPDPTTSFCFQCRPAADIISKFPGFTSPGLVSAALQVGNRIYGMIGSGLNSGKDQPFIYDVIAGNFISVTGITNNNTPTTQPSTGDWTPPSMAMVGTKIYVTHPGFTGSNNAYFGIFDVSGFTETITGNISSGSNLITGNPDISGVFGGMPISGTGIPANSTVLNKANVSFNTTGTTHTSTTIDGIASMTGIAVGQQITGVGIPAGTTVSAVNIAGSSITISQAATASASIELFFTGTSITISANATANTNNLSINISGGTFNAPLWTASNTTENALPTPPSVVIGFNNRTYFGFGPYLAFTDTLNTNMTLATQIVQIGDTTPITAMSPLALTTLIQGNVQSIIVFKEGYIAQVTGDIALNNFSIAEISPEGVGTVSGNAVSTTPIGVFFPATDGMRVVNLSGTVSDPLPDLQVPFINPITPTRNSGAYTNGVYRVCLRNSSVDGTPFQEFWYDLKRKIWTGPHTFQQNIIVPFNETFIAFSNAFPATIYQSDVVQGLTSSFTENGAPLSWLMETTSLADLEDLMMNSMVVSSLNLAFKAGAPSIQCIAQDEDGTIVGQAIINAPGTPSIWGAFTWGINSWFGLQYGLRPRQIPWTTPLIFSKLTVLFKANSSLGFQISNFQGLYQPLSYVSTPYGQPANSSPPPVPPIADNWDVPSLTWDLVDLDWS